MEGDEREKEFVAELENLIEMIEHQKFRKMLPLLCIFLPMILGVADASEELYNNYLINVEDNILKSVRTTPASTDYLDLSYLNLEGIERKAFNDVSNVKRLNLAWNGFTYLPPLVFLALENLEDLSLAGNYFMRFQSIPTKNIFIGLKNLKSLNLLWVHRSDTDFPPSNFAGIPTSTNVLNPPDGFVIPNLFPHNQTESYALLCINNGIVKFLKVVNNTENLRAAGRNCESADVLDNEELWSNRLELQERNIIGFEEDWYHLAHLPISRIDLSHNKISNITNVTTNNADRHLITLKLNNNNIRYIEDGVLARTSLKTLSLSHNKLDNVQFARTLPSTLDSLLVDHNNIVEILPDDFSTKSRLIWLDLQGNKLERLGKDVFNGLKNIRFLDFSENSLKEINIECFRPLSHLIISLKLAYNEITRLESGTFNGSLIRTLDLSHNKIREIEYGTFTHARINYLNLSNNLLTGLDTLVNLPNVQNIDLSGNPLKLTPRSAINLSRNLS